MRQPPSALVALVLAANRSEPEPGLAHADDEAQFTAADARQNILLDVLGRVFEQDRAALAVGDEVDAHRRVGDAEFFGDHVALQVSALVAAVALRPGHADPALGADAPAEGAVVGVAVPSAWCGSKVPAALSSARNARTSARSASHSGGRRIGSNCRCAVIARRPGARNRRRRAGRHAGRVRPPNSFRYRSRRARTAGAA